MRGRRVATCRTIDTVGAYPDECRTPRTADLWPVSRLEPLPSCRSGRPQKTIPVSSTFRGGFRRGNKTTPLELGRYDATMMIPGFLAPTRIVFPIARY